MAQKKKYAENLKNNENSIVIYEKEEGVSDSELTAENNAAQFNGVTPFDITISKNGDFVNDEKGNNTETKQNKENLSQVNPQLNEMLATINDKSSFDNSIHDDTQNVNSSAEETSQQNTGVSYPLANLPAHTITEDTDTRTGETIYTLKFNEHLTPEQFNSARDEIKQNGGYYSRFKKGFIFKDDTLYKAYNEVYNKDTNTADNKAADSAEIGVQSNDTGRNVKETAGGLLQEVSGAGGPSDTGAVRGIRDGSGNGGGNEEISANSQRQTGESVLSQHDAGTARSISGHSGRIIEQVSAFIKKYASKENYTRKNYAPMTEMGAREFIEQEKSNGYTLVDEGEAIISYLESDGKNLSEEIKSWVNRLGKLGITVHISDGKLKRFIEGYCVEFDGFYHKKLNEIFLSADILKEDIDAKNHELFHYIFKNYPEIADRFINTLFSNISGEFDSTIQRELDWIIEGYADGNVLAEENVINLANELTAYFITYLNFGHENSNLLNSIISDRAAVEEAFNQMLDELERARSKTDGDADLSRTQENINKGENSDVQQGVLGREDSDNDSVRESESVQKVEKDGDSGKENRNADELSGNENGVDVRDTQEISSSAGPESGGTDDNGVRKSDVRNGNDGTGHNGTDNVDVNGSADSTESGTNASTERSATSLPAGDTEQRVEKYTENMPAMQKSKVKKALVGSNYNTKEYGEQTYAGFIERSVSDGREVTRKRSVKSKIAKSKYDSDVSRDVKHSFEYNKAKYHELGVNNFDFIKELRALKETKQGGEHIKAVDPVLYYSITGDESVLPDSAYETEYRVMTDGNVFYPINKTAYDYAQWLKDNAVSNGSGTISGMTGANAADSTVTQENNLENAAANINTAENTGVSENIGAQENEKSGAVTESGSVTEENSDVAREKANEQAEELTEEKENDSDGDETILKAMEVAVESGSLSTALLQRKLRLGYSETAKIMDKLEELGVIGAYEGSKPRKVLISYDEYLAMREKLKAENGTDSADGDDDGDISYSFNGRDNSTDKENAEITESDVITLRSIGRKSVNDFTAEDIKKAEPFARKYYAEMGAKSPFLRAWFGDWRARDNTKVSIANVKGNERGKVKNTDTGWEIQVSSKVFNETKSHNSTQATGAVTYLDYINDIVKKAVLLDSYIIPEGKTKSVNSAMMHSLYAIADMGNGNELIKLYVEEQNDINNDGTIKRAYQLQNIVKAPAASVRVQNNIPSSLTSTASADTYTVSQLFDLVKSYDKNFKPGNASKVVNDDGTPKVVYHGTNSEINAFDLSKSGTNEGSTLGKGIYLTDVKSIAESFGKNVYELYASIKRPFDLGQRGTLSMFYNKLDKEYGISKLYGEQYSKNKLKGENSSVFDFMKSLADKNGVDVSDILQSLGFDGVHDGNEWVAYGENQVKSTDNIGLYGKDTDNIFYSFNGRDNSTGEENKYSYKSLTEKEDMPVTKMQDVPEHDISAYKEDRSYFGKEMVKRAARYGKNPKNTETQTYIRNDSTGKDIMVAKDSFKHGAARMDAEYIQVCENISGILKNAIAVNELKSRDGNGNATVFIGAAENKNDYVFVRMITDSRTQKLTNYDILYAIRKKGVKKEGVGTKPPGSAENGISVTPSTISITKLFDIVKGQELFAEVLSKDVKNALNIENSADNGSLDSILYSFNGRNSGETEQAGQSEQTDKGKYIPKGEKPFRDVNIPKEDAYGGKVSYGIRTYAEAESTPDERIATVLDDVKRGKYSHKVISDESALINAENLINTKGYAIYSQDAVTV